MKVVDKNVFSSQKFFLMMLLYAVVSLNNMLEMPVMFINRGGLGYAFFTTLCFIFIGIPLVYMELVISQFTKRDCIDIWKIRPCVSHIGFFTIINQIAYLLYNHVQTSIMLFYLFLTFESKPPYHTCGIWANEDCDIIKYNYSINRNCVKNWDNAPNFCNSLITTFPEYQYYKRELLKSNKASLTIYINWKLLFASALLCIVLIFHCCKGVKSWSFLLFFNTLYPLIAFVILLWGSVKQKGVIWNFPDVIDAYFSKFTIDVSVSELIYSAIYSVGSGTGVLLNLGCIVSFRAPIYSSTVIAVLLAAVVTILSTVLTALIACPFVTELGLPAENFLQYRVSFANVKVPIFLNEFNYPKLYLFFFYSSVTVVGVTTSVVYFYSLLELLLKRFERLKKYRFATIVGLVTGIFFLTLPAFGSVAKKLIGLDASKILSLLSIFITFCESIAFVMCYGYKKLYEDIHFMQSLQPNRLITFCFPLLPIVLLYVFVSTLCFCIFTTKNKFETYAFYCVIGCLGLIFVVFFVKLLIGAIKKEFKKQFSLDPQWGPSDEILKKSRNMFSAHAMTKEYMYRQFRLKAGIYERQSRSNVRVCPRDTFIAHLQVDNTIFA